jgi:hypothetical protein
MAKAPVIRIPRPRVSEIELCAWVAQAAPGAPAATVEPAEAAQQPAEKAAV